MINHISHKFPFIAYWQAFLAAYRYFWIDYTYDAFKALKKAYMHDFEIVKIFCIFAKRNLNGNFKKNTFIQALQIQEI